MLERLIEAPPPGLSPHSFGPRLLDLPPLHLEGRRGGDCQRREGGSRTSAPAKSTLEKLVSAAGAHAFFDFDFGYGLSSGKVSALLDRTSAHTVSQGGSAAQPVWGVQSPTGRRGASFVNASSTYLAGAAALAGILDGLTPFSTLLVLKPTSTSLQTIWSAGDSATSTNHRLEGLLGTAAHAVVRSDVGATSNSGGTHVIGNMELLTSEFTGSAVSVWMNGSNIISASANTRAPVCDLFVLGARRDSGAYGRYLNADLWCAIYAPQWTTQQRQDCQGYAKEWWGTP